MSIANGVKTTTNPPKRGSRKKKNRTSSPCTFWLGSTAAMVADVDLYRYRCFVLDRCAVNWWWRIAVCLSVVS